MSYEESLRAVAESNTTLAASNNKLAAALDKYADTITQYGGKVISLATGKEIAAPAEAKAEATPQASKAKPGRPAKAKAEEAPAAKSDDDGFDDDGFGEEEVGTVTYTHDDVKAKLLEVRDAYDDKTPALKMINDKFGYKGIPDIQEKDYAKIIAEADKLIAKAKK